MQGADLEAARLQRADLEQAQLQGAELGNAELQGAILGTAQLQLADLDGAQLQGANLVGALLQGTSLVYADLRGAEMPVAKLKGADLVGAQLQGADLTGAQLQGAFLGKVHIQGAVGIVPETNLGLADLRGTDFITPLSSKEVTDLLAAISEIPNRDRRASAANRLHRMLTAGQSTERIVFTASPQLPVLVSDPGNPVFADIPTNWLMRSPTPVFATALALLLGDGLATVNSAIAEGIARRAHNGIIDGMTRSLYTPLACRLLANVRTDKVKLEQETVDDLTNELRTRKIECGPATSSGAY
jgi:uncharacterized protein YjbI with pentapeptide repeats